MLAKKHRLNLAQAENAIIFERGLAKIVGSNFLLAYFRPNDKQLFVSCLIPRAIFSKASQRNHYRRLLYSFLEKALAEKDFSLDRKIDLVILLKKNFREATDKDRLEKDFHLLLQKIDHD